MYHLLAHVPFTSTCVLPFLVTLGQCVLVVAHQALQCNPYTEEVLEGFSEKCTNEINENGVSWNNIVLVSLVCCNSLEQLILIIILITS